ncbi:MAG: hypothetical protein GWM98_04675 [Nitrospinaceae bacterium]|nr:hypothetical protein [Deltaproteobacteria bacterium]NIY14214.1 hypothetical protein [Nitrospinaceae bacterium]
MPALYSRPAKIPRWADTSGNITEPSEGKKDAGWLYKEIPPSSWENWRTNLIGDWFRWLAERFDDYTTADDFIIWHPGLEMDALRFLETGADLTLEFTGRYIRYDGTETDMRIGFDGLDVPLIFFGYNSSIGGFRAYQAGDSALFLDSQTLTLFTDYNYADGRRGFVLYNSTSSPYETQAIFNTAGPGGDIPKLVYNPGRRSFSMQLDDEAAQTIDGAVEGDGTFEFDRLANLYLRYNLGGTAIGGKLTFESPNRTTARQWRWTQQSDYYFLQSFDGGLGLEKTYLYFGGPASDAVIWDQDAELYPSSTGGKIGTSTNRWLQGNFNRVYEYGQVYLFTYGSNIAAGTGATTAVTPNNAIAGNGMQVDGSYRLYNTTAKGRFLAVAQLSFDVVTTNFDDEIEIRLYRGLAGGAASELTNFRTYHRFGQASGHENITVIYYLQFDTLGTAATGDYYYIAIRNDTGNSVAFEAESHMSVSPIALYQ